MTTVNRYLQAPGRMTKHNRQDFRTFARKILWDLGEKGVNVIDYLRPYMSLPPERLDESEKTLRKLAEQPTKE